MLFVQIGEIPALLENSVRVEKRGNSVAYGLSIMYVLSGRAGKE